MPLAPTDGGGSQSTQNRASVSISVGPATAASAAPASDPASAPASVAASSVLPASSPASTDASSTRPESAVGYVHVTSAASSVAARVALTEYGAAGGTRSMRSDGLTRATTAPFTSTWKYRRSFSARHWPSSGSTSHGTGMVKT